MMSRMSASPPGLAGNRATEEVSADSGRERERVVVFSPRSILTALGVLLAVAAAVGFLFLAEAALTLIAIALFLALALNPAVEFFRRQGLGRGTAVGAVYVLALAILAVLGLVFIPPLVDQVTKFVAAIPGLVADLTKGHGPLGFLETKYHVVERVRDATTGQNPADLTGEAGPALDVVKGVATTVFGLIIIGFLTLFMLLEGPDWRERFTELVPERNRARVERIGIGVYKAIGGFVTGNLLASLLAGVVAAVVLLIVGVPFAIPLGLFVAIVELVPYIGPVVATVILTAVAFTQGPVSGAVVFGLILVYHMIEGHTLRPVIYGRALRLSPLAVLIAILLGTEIAGVLGALAAIPIAGSIQVIISEVLQKPEAPSEEETVDEGDLGPGHGIAARPEPASSPK
jgi:predicted PurR-regulated permease PerM